MIIKTSDLSTIKPFLNKLVVPKHNSHKGQNGKLLVIGGSSLFHAASIWSASIASKIVDLVHYSSTLENEKIFINLKSKFANGIVIRKADVDDYIKEDDCILVGPGMVRGKIKKSEFSKNPISITDEPTYTSAITKYLLSKYPDKRIVLDGGALQMMQKEWLVKTKVPTIITPHKQEFEKLFGINVNKLDHNEKKKRVREIACKYKTVILLKAVSIYISGGKEVFVVQGGNAGLTKGGTGDVLAGVVAALYTKNDPITSAVCASWLLKKTAERLSQSSDFWYNSTDLVTEIPKVFKDSVK